MRLLSTGNLDYLLVVSTTITNSMLKSNNPLCLYTAYLSIIILTTMETCMNLCLLILLNY